MERPRHSSAPMWGVPIRSNEQHICLVADLRQGDQGVCKMQVFPTEEANKAELANQMRCNPDDIVMKPYESDVHDCRKLVCIGAQENDFILLVRAVNFRDRQSLGYHITLVLSEASTVRDCLMMMQSYIERDSGEHLKIDDLVLCVDRQLLNDIQTCLSKRLKSFDQVDLVRTETMNVTILHRADIFKEESYFIECCNTDSVLKVKQKLFDVCASGSESNDVSHICLIYRGNLLSDNTLLHFVFNPFSVHMIDSKESAKQSLTVAFLPDEAVAVSVHFKSGQHYKDEEAICVPRTVSVKDLRYEVAKVLHRNPNSFNLLLNGKKIIRDTDLECNLKCGRNKLVVDQQHKIQINVDVINDAASPNFAVMLYKFDSVSTLKQEICKKVHVVEYCVDLQGHSLPLLDEESLHICRIRDGDLVQATILRHRIRVKIHISGYAFVNVMVDDSCDTTVGGLKEFVHSQLERQPGTQQVETTSASEVTGHTDVDLTVIYRGNALPDGVTLAEAGVVMDAKLQIVTIEKLCYTAAAVSGSFPIFFCNQDGRLIRRRTAMSNGEKIFLDPWDIHTPAGERGDNNIVTNVCRNRQPMPSGVRLCSKKDFQLLSCQSLLHSRAKANDTAKQGHGGCPRSVGIPSTSTAATTSRDTPEPGAVQSSRKRKSNGETTETSTAMPDPCSSLTSVGPSCSGTLPPERETAGVLLPDCASSLATLNTDDVMPSALWPARTPSSRFGLSEQRLSHFIAASFLGDIPNARPNQMIPERVTHAPESLDSGTDKTGCTRQMSSIIDSLSSCVSELESELETSGSETIISRRNVTKDINGRVVSEQFFFKKTSISPDLIQHFEGSAASPSQNPFFPGLPSAGHLPGASLPADASAAESVFAYISKDIIHCVATQLEGDGNLMFFSTLGLRAGVYNEIEKQHGSSFSNKNYVCLMRWCQTCGSAANTEKLKKTLAEMERNDIREEVETLEAKEKGYKTC